MSDKMSKDQLNEMFDYPIWSLAKFLESEYCTICLGCGTVKRTWQERLFTRPWTPWVATKIDVVYGPDPMLYETSRGVYVGHPVTVAAVRKALGERSGA